jgi:hypothetical protein
MAGDGGLILVAIGAAHQANYAPNSFLQTLNYRWGSTIVQ